jgi:hypothetical protein
MTRTLSRLTLALVLAGGIFATSFPLWADLVVNYTLKTATLQEIKEVSIYRTKDEQGNNVIMVSAQYEIVDSEDVVRIPNGFVDDISLTGPELSTLVGILSGPVLDAINLEEGLEP